MQKYAEEVNFWQTGRSGSDVWMERGKRQIEELGGIVQAEGFGSDGYGRAAFMLVFSMEEDAFKIVWPVLQSKTGKVMAARVQAATMLYHYVKSVCLYAVVVGARSAFFSHLMLPDGRMASQVAGNELQMMAPSMFLLPPPQST
jgi:hypothetical protein